MRSAGALRTAIAFLLLVILHFSVRPLLAWRAAPDFLIIALLLVAIRVRPGVAALVGLLMGLTADSLTMHAFGASGLGMAIVGFGASWLKAVFFADDLLLNAFFILLGKWVFDVIYLVAEHQLAGGELLIRMLVWSPLAAATTALAGVALLLVLRPVLRARPT